MFVVAAAVGLAVLGAPREAVLHRTDGREVMLSSHRGKPQVLFYEDRDSTEQNATLKRELFARGREEGLLESVGVIAIANLKAYDWFPARGFAVAAVRDAERIAGIPVLVDWRGALRLPPWSLPAKTSSVVVLDPQGLVAFEVSGALTSTQRAELFAVLKRLL